jgi:hypothetical protein
MRKISVASTYANDILINDQGQVLERRPGGPMYFIRNALEKTSVPFTTFCCEPLDVEILVTSKGEFGKVPGRPIKRHISELGKEKGTVLVSTLLDEWVIDPENIPEKLCIDLQGYVRSADNFGKKRAWIGSEQFGDKVFCMKGTEEEVNCLPPSVRESQKQRLLIVTKGEKGLDVYCNGRLTELPASPVTGPSDTIGAGDTFFAYFVVNMCKGYSAVVAAQDAMRKVATFLKEKKQ